MRSRTGRWALLLLAGAALAATGIASGQTAEQPMLGNCSDCHLCSVPTARVPCLKACPRTTMVHQTSIHALAEAPDSLLLNDLVDLY